MKLHKIITTITLAKPHKKALESEAKSLGTSTSQLIEEMIEARFESTHSDLKQYINLRNQLNNLVTKEE